MSKELIKQAIADAKALRESAYELAKEQIAETFGPKVQEMIRLKLSEMDDESLAENTEELAETPEEMKEWGDEHAVSLEDALGDAEVNETSLDEILAELDAEDEMQEAKKDEDSLDEAKKDDEEAETEEDETEEAETEEDETEAGEAEEAEEVTELTVDELRDIIRDVVTDVVSGGAGEAAGEEMPGEETLEPEMGAGEEMPGGEVAGEEEISLDEILASLEEEDAMDAVDEAKKKDKEEKVDEAKETKEELKEAINTIKKLRKELSEVNLFNAKLLYVNKIFKSKNLNESQKIKVVNAFDRAETVKEAKKIYETIQEAVPTIKKKTSMKESTGFASKPVGSIQKTKPIVEQNDVVSRWQVLAGIKKIN